MKLSSLWDISFFRDGRGHLKNISKMKLSLYYNSTNIISVLLVVFLMSKYEGKLGKKILYFPPTPTILPWCPFFQFDQMWSSVGRWGVGTISHPSSFSESSHEAHQSGPISPSLSGDIRHPSCHSNIFYFVPKNPTILIHRHKDASQPSVCLMSSPGHLMTILLIVAHSFLF